MMNKTIAFIGFMGVGKSMVSKHLANILKREVISTDRVIEAKEKMTIADLFRTKGEKYFRQAERDVVKEIGAKKNIIIDCGGGVVLNEENLKFLKENTILICLSASADFIYEMVKKQKDRPLLNVADPKEKIRELLEGRKHLYAQAHYDISTEYKTADQICKEVLKILPHD